MLGLYFLMRQSESLTVRSKPLSLIRRNQLTRIHQTLGHLPQLGHVFRSRQASCLVNNRAVNMRDDLLTPASKAIWRIAS